MKTRAIITVVEYPSMPGRYKIKSDAAKDKRGIMFCADAKGEAAAAAIALELAQRVGSRGYQIFATEKVSAMIPSDMRGRE